MSRSFAGSGWRLGEWRGGEAWGKDLRLKRLVVGLGRKLDPEAIAAVVDSLPVPASEWRRSEPSKHPGATLAIDPRISAEWRTALASPALVNLTTSLGLQLTGDTNAPGSALLTVGNSVSAWEALAQGRELVCVASSPFSDLNLTHDAVTPDDLPAALTSLASAQRNRRDAARLALATESLFNTILDDTTSMSDALDEAIRSIGRLPRQSVSIVITCYNYEAFVGEAIASARHQTVPAHEIIVVDDGSTDGSAAVIRATPDIETVFRKNGGQASAFNAGFARTTGDLVLFLDADDRLLPTAVEELAKVDTRGLSRVQFGLESIDGSGRSTGCYPMKSRAARGHLAGPLLADGIFPFMPTSGNAFPREALRHLFPIPEKNWRICADLFLVLACATQGETAEIGEVLGQYRVHGRNGYFRTLGAEHYLSKEKREQHRRAWRDIAAVLQRSPDPARADRFRLALHRLTQSAESNRAPLGLLAEVARGVRLAISAHALPAGERVAHAVFGLRRLLAGGNGESLVEAKSATSPVDLVEQAGRTTWPVLGPSNENDMLIAMATLGLFGRGWSEPDAGGACLDAAEGFMGFRVPRLSSHWRLRLDFTVIGAEPVRGVEIRLNGTPIDQFDLSVRGGIELKLPAGLLLDWSQFTAAPPHFAACLTFHVTAGDVGRLKVLPVGLDILPDMLPGAPMLRDGQLLRIGALEGPHSPAADTQQAGHCLGEGWEWPDERSAALAGDRGRLYLSVPTNGRHALTILLDGDPGADLSECLQFSVNGALVAYSASSDRRSLTFEMPFNIAIADGRSLVELVVYPERVTGTWPLVRIAGLRLDRLDHHLGRPQLVPNVPLEIGEVLATYPDAGEGLARDAKGARVLSEAFRLKIGLPTLDNDALMLVRIVAATTVADPVAARLSIDGQDFEFWLGRDNLLPLVVPRGQARTVLLEGLLRGGSRRYALQSLQLRMAPITFSPAPANSGMTGGEDLVSGSVIEVLAQDPMAWHRPVEGVIWLAVHHAYLALPPLPPQVHSLDVTVLTIGNPAQGLSVAVGSSCTSTEKAGLQVLRVKLPRNAPKEGLRLDVSSGLLVSSDAMGAAGPGMLGGGVCRIEAVADESSAAPRASSAASRPRRKSLRQAERAP